MKLVTVMLNVEVQIEMDDNIATNEDLLYDKINEMEYSFNYYDSNSNVVDYYIPEFQILSVD